VPPALSVLKDAASQLYSYAKVIKPDKPCLDIWIGGCVSLQPFLSVLTYLFYRFGRYMSSTIPFDIASRLPGIRVFPHDILADIECGE